MRLTYRWRGAMRQAWLNPFEAWHLAWEALADGGPVQAAHFDALLHEVGWSAGLQVRVLAWMVHLLCLRPGWRRLGESPSQFRDRIGVAGPGGSTLGFA